MPRTFQLMRPIKKKANKKSSLDKKKLVSTGGTSPDWTENDMYSMIHAACVHAIDGKVFGYVNCCAVTQIKTVPKATFEKRLNEIAEYFAVGSFDEMRKLLKSDPSQ